LICTFSFFSLWKNLLWNKILSKHEKRKLSIILKLLVVIKSSLSISTQNYPSLLISTHSTHLYPFYPSQPISTHLHLPELYTGRKLRGKIQHESPAQFLTSILSRSSFWNINKICTTFFNFKNQDKNIPMVLPSSPIKIWGESVKGIISYDRTYKQTNRDHYTIHKKIQLIQR